jgi:Domain of unknown function (DUF4159)
MRPMYVLLPILAGLAAVVAVPDRIPAADAKPEPLVDQVRAAMDNGVRFLKRTQRGRNWENEVNIPTQMTGGTTSLVLLALLNCDVRPDDPVVQRGLEYLRAVEPQFTYVVGLQTMVFAQVGDPKDMPRIQRNVDWLVRARRMDGDTLLGWSYTEGQGGGADNSNSQYALLGLHAGRQAGASVSQAVWQSIYDFYKQSQQPDGGWIYSERLNRGTSLTMTIAGLSGLSIASQELEAGTRKLNPDGSDPKCGVYTENEAIRKALAWLAVEDRAGDGNRVRFDEKGNAFYNIYGIERAGRLTGQRLLAGHDWYREGCKFLVTIQHEEGSWYRPGVHDGWAPISTSFALLFLSKGRTPILISKLAHGQGEDWNRKHHDARHLAEFASKELFKRQPLAWQVYDPRGLPSLGGKELKDEVGNLLQSPILYMNGHKAPELRAIEKKLLRQYLDEGGFLLAEACCGDKRFADEFRKLMKDPLLFPETELTKLGSTHPIWSAHFALPKTFMADYPLEGIEQGCKTVVVFSPKPLAGYWEVNKWSPRVARLDVPATDRGTLAFRLAGNIIAYATGLEMPKPRLTKVELPADEERRVPRGFLKVAQLKHEGDWQPAPRAIPNLMRHVRAEEKLDVELKEEDLPIGSPDIYLYKFLYMHGRNKFDVPADQVDHLRANLKTGGLLLADACCGKPEFDRAFRTFAKQLFPDANLEPIPPDDPLYGAEVNRTAITTVRLRRERPDGQGAEAEFRDSRPTYLEGIKVGGRWVVIYSRYDIGCALEKHASSDCRGYDHESALKIGTAAVMYALKK